MKVAKRTTTLTAACVGAISLLMYAHAADSLKFDFSDETVGADPKSLVSIVGVWRIESEGNNKVLAVDGRQWKEGQAAAHSRLFSCGRAFNRSCPPRGPNCIKG
jgi:hypothetical protein